MELQNGAEMSSNMALLGWVSRSDLQSGEFVETLYKKQVDPRFSLPLRPTSDFPFSKQQLRVYFLKRLNQSHSLIRGTRQAKDRRIILRTRGFTPNTVRFPEPLLSYPQTAEGQCYPIGWILEGVPLQKWSYSRVKTH